jgi:hypothetical protein
MTAVTLNNSAWFNSFDAPVTQKHPTTNLTFGEGNTESYMVVGTFKDFCVCVLPSESGSSAVCSKTVVWCVCVCFEICCYISPHACHLQKWAVQWRRRTGQCRN